MINQSTVETALLKWIEEFVEVPHPNLGNWPPCPYARQARLSNNIDIRLGTDPYTDCLSLLEYDWQQEAIIFWYDHNIVTSDKLLYDVNNANQILLANDIVALEDHPDAEEIINGVKMNFGYCAIIILQKNSKLNSAADQLRSKGYYDTWTQTDIDKITTWRYK
jgi:hypothetical protein